MNYLHDIETRVTDHATGGQKGAKRTRIGALDPVAQIEVGRVAGMGAEKYSAFNYLKGFDWSLAYDAMQRHANLWWAGEDRDPESGLSHMAHVSWMAQALVSFSLRRLGTDDRPPSAFTQQDTLAAKLEHAGRLADAGLVTMEEMAAQLRPVLGVEQPAEDHPPASSWIDHCPGCPLSDAEPTSKDGG